MVFNTNMEDAITELISSELCPSTVEKALYYIGYGTCDELYAPSSALHLILVYSQSEYSFTSNEIDWLKNADTVLSYQTDNDICLFFVEMNCSNDEYYTACAAIIKIFNMAFLTENLFVFRLSENIAFGIAREITRKVPNNFAVSGLINSNNLEKYDELFGEFTSSFFDELPYLIMESSPQEHSQSKKHDTDCFDLDYLSFLYEFESIYSVDTLKKKNLVGEEQNDFYLEHKKECSYKVACEELKDIAESDGHSSYEDLNAAQLAEEKAAQFQSQFSSGTSTLLSNETTIEYSEEAFKNAETMLKEMMRKEK